MVTCCWIGKGKDKQFYLCSDETSIVALPSKYLRYKKNINRSINTVEADARSLTYYMNYLIEKGLTEADVLKMSYEKQYRHFVDFLNWIKSGNHTDKRQKRKNDTCDKYLGAVFGYYSYLLDEDLAFEGRIRVREDRILGFVGKAGVRGGKVAASFPGKLPTEKGKGKTATKEEIIQYLSACSKNRDRLLILIAAETGFRIGEILGINWRTDIDYDNKRIGVKRRDTNENEALAKNDERRWIKVSDDLITVLYYYIADNRKSLEKSNFLFLTRDGNPMNVSAVYSVLRTLEKRTGVHITPHTIRHYFAQVRYDAGVRLEVIQQMLGQAHIQTTLNYIEVREKVMDDVQRQYFEASKDIYRRAEELL